MFQIAQVRAREVLDSRGNPTVEAEVLLAGGAFGRAAVPSGASTGALEAIELRDGGGRYGGKGVERAVGHVNERIAPAAGRARRHRPGGVDQVDVRPGCHPQQGRPRAPTPSWPCRWRRPAPPPPPAACPCSATSAGRRPGCCPMPMLNVLNGGVHAANSVDIQEFMVVPAGLPTFREALRAGVEVYHALKKVLAKAWPGHQRRRRGRLRPRPGPQPRGPRGAGRGGAGRRVRAGPPGGVRPRRRPPPSSTATAPITSTARP